MRRTAAWTLAALLLLACPGSAGAANATGEPAAAQQSHDSHPAAPEAAVKKGPSPKPPLPVNPAAGVTERLGQHADLDVELLDEGGQRLRLSQLVDKPTILAPVYYSCPNECNVLLGTLATVLPQVGLKPGVDYQVLAVSFDDRDTPATATKRKGDFFNAGAAGFPPLAWRFFTGDEQNVRRLMDSVGFGYQRAGDAFQHSVALIVLTPTGKISRYLYGIRPLAFDIALATTEAGAEKTGFSVKRAIAMCYTYDPAGRRYVFDFVKVAGAGVLAALGIFGLFLAFGGKKRGADKKGPQA
ncbi:MAG: SCO family protein [Humidesulfovibrio sp.]|uniref:SCO family protein n=1 Tax=Humidesulfovibrio sp. TaxID=2910988 RepID=UPI0027374136|nr:SCO family protein [Humidesulfovibrio sp.]MDP2847492.1 SCO family protein [Humidesulfovibrio sp.]